MCNITFEDYKKAVKAKYELEKEGVYFNFLIPPSQANLRKLCWERFKLNDNKDDLSIFSSFFDFDFDLSKKNNFKEQTDRFRPIGSFLKGEKEPANRYAVELAAILVDFELRPFRKFSEKAEINEKNLNKNSSNLESNNDEGKVESGENGITVRTGIKEKNRSKFYDKLLKRSKTTMIVVATVFCLISAVIYFAFIKKHCMQWSGNHYEVVDCNSGIVGDLNDIIPFDDNLVDFRKVEVCDTTTCFAPDGQAIIWYCKKNNKVDFFNTHGRHPENGKPLRPVTQYILNKYVLKNK